MFGHAILKGWVNAFNSNKMDNQQETKMVNNGEGSSEKGQEVDVGDFNGGQAFKQEQPQEADEVQEFLGSDGALFGCLGVLP